MALSDVVPFFRAWVADPKRVASITPSGPRLAELLTREITAETGPILELGAGTGVVTRALLARGVRESDLTLVEYGSEFTRTLERRFPHARVLCSDAVRLGQVDLYPGDAAGAVVSGLPLLAMTPRQIIGILSGAFAHLRPGGTFYQFTYVPRCPIPRPILDRLGLKSTRVGRTFLNIPPATVYRITRRTPPKFHAAAV
jgi:phosphatidylethanolamine/phosphatidyl-N-methylethanolamine N-methyltransferase